MAYFTPVLQALNDAGVEYVIVGGVATVLHGHARLTTDIDLVIDLERSNVERAVDVLTKLGLKPRLPVDPKQFADPVVRKEWVEQRGMMVFSMFDPSNATVGVDIFADGKQDFQKLRQRSVMKKITGAEIRVCSLDDLIEMKTAAGRPIDQQDVESLKVIHDRR